jgi:AraC-like DNA-binding protein
MEIIVTTLIWAAVFQGFLLGIIFIFSKKHKSFSNKLLGLFLITFIFSAVSDLIPFDYIVDYNISRLFATPEVKLLSPVLFLHYVLQKIGRTNFFKTFLKVNYSIAIAIVSISLINLILFLTGKKTIYDLFETNVVESFYMIQQYYAFLFTVVVSAISIIETLKYRKIAKNEFSDLTMLSISWLWQFIFILAPVIVLWGAELLRIIFGGLGQSEIVTVAWGFIALFIYFVSYKAFTHQDLFDKSKQEIIRKENATIVPEKEKLADGKKSCESIKEAMETGQYFLNHDLTIHQFAKEINKSPRLISNCINQSFGFNFNEWVNNYRVEKALEILQDKNNDHLSIEGVGADSGFKSRSAMYIAFKKKTGETPGHFRSN